MVDLLSSCFHQNIVGLTVFCSEKGLRSSFDSSLRTCRARSGVQIADSVHSSLEPKTHTYTHHG